ncbi:MAG: hypothetical protein ACKVVT_15915 [Dehalococcoidia bacterium]
MTVFGIEVGVLTFLGLSFSIALSVVISHLVQNLYFDNDSNGTWELVRRNVVTERRVDIGANLEVDQNLDVKGALKVARDTSIDGILSVAKDLVLGSDGTFIQMSAVNCPAELPVPSGTGRLCLDQAQGFVVATGTDGYQPLRSAGVPGKDGAPGKDGKGGQACWDLNANGLSDVAAEDANRDGRVDVTDCRTAPSKPGRRLLQPRQHRSFLSSTSRSTGGRTPEPCGWPRSP